MTNKTKERKRLDDRVTFRADPETHAEFERLVSAGGFCRSSVLRKLQKQWVLETKLLLDGAE